jgi:hypothetical protein
MEEIVFQHGTITWTRTHSLGPRFNLKQVHSFEIEKGWHHRIGKVCFEVEMRALDLKGNILGNPTKRKFCLAKYINVDYQQAALAFKESFDLRESQPNLDLSKCSQWKVDVTISGIDFRPKETLSAYYMIDHP